MKKLFTLTLALNCFLLTVIAQPFQIGHRLITFIDASRANRIITTAIYYPAVTAGNNVTIATGQFPIIVFGHGFVMDTSAYDVFRNAIVPSGYIIVFPTTESSFSPSHTDFGKDIAFLVGAMKAEGLNSSSAFFGSVTSKSAVMGHSMGGGCSYLAVQYASSITVLASFAAAVTNPSSIIAARNITIPSIVFSGVNDCVAPPATNQIPMYDTLASVCKSLINITGGAHCLFASMNNNCYFGQGTCSPQPTISAAAQQTTTFNLLLPWLNYYLKNDCAAGNQFQGLITVGSGITSKQNCSIGCSVGINEIQSDLSVSVYPNPASVSIHINTSNIDVLSIKLINILGETVYQTMNKNSQTIIDVSRFVKGIYLVSVTDNKRNVTNKKIIIQ